MASSELTHLKKEWCSTHTFHSRLAARWFSSLKPMVDSNWSNWEGAESHVGQPGTTSACSWSSWSIQKMVLSECGTQQRACLKPLFFFGGVSPLPDGS